MKIKRQKNSKKIVKFYKRSYNFKEPFQVLLDGTFCQAALTNQINIKEQLPKYLNGQITFYTTSCILHELNNLGKPVYGAFHIAKQYKIKTCDHVDKSIAANKCLLSMVKKGNPSHYWIASQDPEITSKLSTYISVPLLYISYKAIHLTKPNDLTHKTADNLISQSLLNPSSLSKNVIKELSALDKSPKETSAKKQSKKNKYKLS
ncbi:unnamed protein product [Gordionus sp. m RMFG-2023]|uniref:rRNA-processing protein UTP23 homolog n=1 Tax=Gordionus sp. m RMFG-2023 TaxID=3053472 RepID=UPI0030E5D052